jgi:DNA-binding beta-propeller fold protein YncE
MRPASANRPLRRVRLLRPAILFGAVSAALFLFAIPGLARGARLSDQNRDGVIDLADVVLFSQTELGQDWQTVDWCQWLQGPYRRERHLQGLLDFIDEHFRCDQGDPFAIHNANKHPTRLAWSADAQQLFVTDSKVGSVFLYDSVATLTGELKDLSKPLGVAVSLQGDIYVGDNSSDAVKVYSSDGLQIATIGAATLKMPNDLAFDQNGQLYVVDSKRNLVEVFDPATGASLRTFGAGVLRFPSALAISGQEVFVADQSNFLVRVFDLQGNLLRSFGGKVTQGFMDYNWEGKFARLQSLAIDSTGRVHALDSHMGMIQILSAADGSYIDSYGANGSAPGELDLPLDIDINQYGETAVANTRNERVELLTPP